MRTCVLLAAVVSLGLGANILPNPSFEVWLDSLGVPMPFGWLTSEYLYPGSALKDTQANSGNYCVRLAGGDTSAFVMSATVVRQGYHYEFAGHALVPGVVGGTFILQFLTLMGNPVGVPELLPVYYSGSYRRYSRWITAPDSALLLSVSLVTLPGAEVLVDDVTVEDSTIAGVESEPEPGRARTFRRKVVVAGARPTAALTEAGPLYDALGRRTAVVGAGVYFRK